MSDPVSPPSSVVPKSKRLDYIDLLRGWAVIVMIETHVFNATLTDVLRSSDFFTYIKFLNGLVAPSFLFASGLAYAITTRRKLNDYLSPGRPLARQFGRLLFIMAIGYVLHIPKFNYTHLVYWTEEKYWRVFFQADVLQCIAASLMLMQGLLFLLRSERRLYLVLSGLTVAVVLLTPVMWGIDFWPILPRFLAGYTNGIHFQNFPGFPLFPWSAFVFAGAIFGNYYLRARDAAPQVEPLRNEAAVMKRSLPWAGAIIAVSFLLAPIAVLVYPTYDYWKFSPSFTMLRLGIVIILCAAMFFYDRRNKVSPASVITLIGRESLIVYATHLLLIYGDFGPFNFFKRVNHTFGYGGAIMTTLTLFVLMYALALFWSRTKRESPRWKLTLQYGTLVVMVGVFFFGPTP